MKIFTDGSSRGNPGPGGWAAILISSESVSELGGREAHTTNNRMEMTAALRGLEAVAVGEKEVTIITDSAYLLNGITKWVKGWKQRDWISSQKQEVLNRDIWEKLSDTVDALADSGVKVSWKLVKGHAGHSLNERCDVIATSFADNEEVDLYKGTFSKYEHGADVSTVAPADSSEGKSKKKSSNTPAYSYVSVVKGVVKIDTTWKECEARVKGVSGTRFKKSISAADEKKIVQEFSGK